MINKLDFSQRRWRPIKKVKLVGNVIISTDYIDDFSVYVPFEYYNKPISPDIVQDILGEQLSNEQPFYLHTLFLSIDPTNLSQVVKWINHFGILIHRDFKELCEELPSEYFDKDGYRLPDTGRPSGLLSDFKEGHADIQAFFAAIELKNTSYSQSDFLSFINKHLLNQYGCLKPALVENLIVENEYLIEKILAHIHEIPENILNKFPEDDLSAYLLMLIESTDWIKNRMTPNPRGKEWFQGNAPMLALIKKHTVDSITSLVREVGEVGLWDRVIDGISGQFLKNIKPNIIARDSVSLEWWYNDLISLIFFMVTLDITSGNPIQKCANRRCRRYIIPSRERHIYCSDTCKNRARQQRHYDKTKQQREGV